MKRHSLLSTPSTFFDFLIRSTSLESEIPSSVIVTPRYFTSGRIFQPDPGQEKIYALVFSLERRITLFFVYHFIPFSIAHVEARSRECWRPPAVIADSLTSSAKEFARFSCGRLRRFVESFCKCIHKYVIQTRA